MIVVLAFIFFVGNGVQLTKKNEYCKSIKYSGKYCEKMGKLNEQRAKK